MNANDILKYGHLWVLKHVETLSQADWNTEGVCGWWSTKISSRTWLHSSMFWPTSFRCAWVKSLRQSLLYSSRLAGMNLMRYRCHTERI